MALTSQMREEVGEFLRQVTQAHTIAKVLDATSDEETLHLGSRRVIKTGGRVLNKKQTRRLKRITNTPYSKMKPVDKKFFDEWIDKFDDLTTAML